MLKYHNYLLKKNHKNNYKKSLYFSKKVYNLMPDFFFLFIFLFFLMINQIIRHKNIIDINIQRMIKFILFLINFTGNNLFSHLFQLIIFFILIYIIHLPRRRFLSIKIYYFIFFFFKGGWFSRGGCVRQFKFTSN